MLTERLRAGARFVHCLRIKSASTFSQSVVKIFTRACPLVS